MISFRLSRTRKRKGWRPARGIRVVHSAGKPEAGLQDIHVLAEDRIIQAVQDKPGTVPGTVTLEVNPYQALELAKAKEAGGKIIPVQGSGSCFPPPMRRPH